MGWASLQGPPLAQSAEGSATPPWPATGPREPPAHSVEVFTFDLHEPLSKERVEAFSDGDSPGARHSSCPGAQ